MASTKDVNVEEKVSKLQFGVHEWPPVFISLAVAIQHMILNFGFLVTFVMTMADVTCVSINDSIRSRWFCSSLFMVGLATVTNSAVGIRLPVFQGVAAPFLFPMLVLRNSGSWTCPAAPADHANNTSANETDEALVELKALQSGRISEIAGSLMVAAMVEVTLGFTGLIGYLLRFLGPIPVSVTITMLGISLYPVPVFMCDVYWPVGFVALRPINSLGHLRTRKAKKEGEIRCAFLIVVFAMYLAPVRVTFPRICQPKSSVSFDYPIFEGFAVLLSMAIGWIICAILTATGEFSDDPNDIQYRARTDTRSDLIELTPWFIIPYPGQFGIPRFNPALFLGFLTCFIGSSVESVGDYYALSKVCQAYPPPPHAVNRGILTEGLMSVLSGSLAIGHGTTSYTPNIVIVSYSKVASRYVLILTGVICMALGLIGKLGAVMSSIPDPVVGGFMLVGLGVMVALGISGLQSVDLSSSRNLSVIGTAMYTGLVASEWLKSHPGQIDTGSVQLNQVIEVLLGNPMLISGITAAILDNTVKGSKTERGIGDASTCKEKRKRHSSALGLNGDAVKIEKDAFDEGRTNTFDLPYVHTLQKKCKLFRYLPFLQPYGEVFNDVNDETVIANDYKDFDSLLETRL